MEDAASAIVRASEETASGLWHVVDDRPVSPLAFMEALASKIRASPPRAAPGWLVRLLAGRSAEGFLTNGFPTSNGRARRDLRWAPRYPTVDEGMEQVARAWREEGFRPGA